MRQVLFPHHVAIAQVQRVDARAGADGRAHVGADGVLQVQQVHERQALDLVHQQVGDRRIDVFGVNGHAPVDAAQAAAHAKPFGPVQRAGLGVD